MAPSFEFGDHRTEVRRYGEPEVARGKANGGSSVYIPPRPRQTGPPPEYTSFPRRKDAGRGRSRFGSAWCFSDPEMKRKKRVASYKMYSVEAKIKSSFKKGIKWIKKKCSNLVHG